MDRHGLRRAAGAVIGARTKRLIGTART